MLEPLTQWRCDRCQTMIASPDDGGVHWRRDHDGKVINIEILHVDRASQRSDGCYPRESREDVALDRMLGPRGIVELLALVDVGAHHARLPIPGGGVGVAEWRTWAEVFRRLHVPYYEEARQFFARALRDGMLDGISEIALYTEKILKRLVETYTTE
jgi:hypothetical protein